ncbi:hypothetical protein [Achromobacter xylosoxidans]|uniref:hypothetical protein n=1 Tax=Alcaligenes xylosoxydans xylosoxydans TaxID=85698 RepID=UPI0005D98A07|nr:hypothetical protein [Achromobacter xylosoxidans]QKQ52653.1 hypothetical protein FOC83_06595 [Achromobacter xylosoxidans]QPR92463.1 hypothetical protein I6G72_17435 [Achromobacter xylosoxidans]UON42143.1 hypothetical protein IUJ48_08550 [Achromobacter xylosoxidans]CKH76264.1 Uncharacterised protein [Achromobacter xylosoxidans]SQG75738.1 Uncharacterised protein [Achromobacter xylosoxidans]
MLPTPIFRNEPDGPKCLKSLRVEFSRRKAVKMGTSVFKWIFAVGCGAAITFVIAFFLDQWFPSGNFANWVQGIGSILAIIGAVWAVSVQSRTTLDSVRKNLDWTEERQQRAVMAVVDAAKDRVDRILNAINSGDDWQRALLSSYARPIIDGIIGALRGFPAHQLPNGAVVTAFLLLQQHLIFFADNVDELIAGPWKHPEIKDVLEQARHTWEASRKPEDREHMLSIVRVSNDALRQNVYTQADQIRIHVATLHAELGSGKAAH